MIFLNYFSSYCSGKKVESEVDVGAAKKDSKRKRELSISDDTEVKTPPASPHEEDEDDGVQVTDFVPSTTYRFLGVTVNPRHYTLWKTQSSSLHRSPISLADFSVSLPEKEHGSGPTMSTVSFVNESC